MSAGSGLSSDRGMDNQEHLNKKELAVKSPGRGMTVSFRKII